MLYQIRNQSGDAIPKPRVIRPAGSGLVHRPLATQHGEYVNRNTKNRLCSTLQHHHNTLRHHVARSTDTNNHDSWTPTVEMYFCVLSSAVPSQLVPSTTQAFHDGIARVAARMSAMTLSFSSRVFPPVPPGAVVDWSCGCMWGCVWALSSSIGSSCCKEPVAVSTTPSVMIQSCQGKSSDADGLTNLNGLCPRTHI